MAGSTSVHGFHSTSSLVQRDGCFLGGDVAALRSATRYASSRRLRIRVARARAVESLETDSPDSSWDDAQTKSLTRQRLTAKVAPRQLAQAMGEFSSREDDSSGADHRSGEDVKLTLQRVLEARALLANKMDHAKEAKDTATPAAAEDVSTRNTINMAREVLAGFRKGATGDETGAGAMAMAADDVQDWSASLVRSGMAKPKGGGLWRRELGRPVQDLHGLTDQPDIVRKVVGALSGLRSHTSVVNTMNGFAGQVTVSDLHQVLYVLGVMKEWLTALQVFQWMQTVPQYKPDDVAYRTIITVLVNARRMNVAEAVFEELVQSGAGPSHDDYVILMSGYTKCGSLQRGVGVLQKMRDAGIRPLLSAYSVLLEGCQRSLRGLEMAAQLREQMRLENVDPDRATYSYMINMYSRKGMYREIIDTFEQLSSSNCLPDRNICHIILTAFSKLGDVRGMLDAYRTLIDMGLQQVSVTFNIIMNTLNRVGRIRDVERYWALMRKSRLVPDLTTCSILINTFGRAREWDKVDLVLAEMETYGIKADLMVFNALMSVYGKAGMFVEVELVVKSLRAEIARLHELGNTSLAFDLVTYNTLLDVYGKAGRLEDVIYWFAEMKKAGVQPDVLTFNSLVNAYGKASHYDGVKEVLELFREYNYKSDLVFYNTLLFMFGKGGHYAEAWKILEDMKAAGFAPSLETYNSLILVFGRGGIQQGLQVFADMIASNVQPNMVTFRLLMDIHAKKGLVEECIKIYHEAQKYPSCKLDDSLMSAALRACCNMRCIEEADGLVAAAEAEGVVLSLSCYNWLILGHGKKGQWQESERILEAMKLRGVRPSPQSYSFLLESYSLSGQIPRGEALIAKMKDHKLIVGTAGHNALLRFYMRAGDVHSAMQTYAVCKPNQSSFLPMIETLTREGAADARLWGVLQDLERGAFESHHTVHATLLAALGRCGPCPRLVEALRRLDCLPDVCALLEEPEPGPEVWARVSAFLYALEREGINLEAERNFHNAMIDALWRCDFKMRALRVTEMSVSFGVFGAKVCDFRADDCWTLDVRFAGTGASQILLLTWLSGMRDTVKSGRAMPARVRILLAWEWQLRTGENWGARDGVSGHLSALKAPFVLVREGQELEAAAGVLRKWLLKEKTAQGLVFTSKL